MTALVGRVALWIRDYDNWKSQKFIISKSTLQLIAAPFNAGFLMTPLFSQLITVENQPQLKFLNLDFSITFVPTEFAYYIKSDGNNYLAWTIDFHFLNSQTLELVPGSMKQRRFIFSSRISGSQVMQCVILRLQYSTLIWFKSFQ